ncbi:hypothetical protein CA51_28990 [Rosistilla oblonga]|uniref:Uncharacterized protein n=1 Tax=Rosistilla oblonga TaxID=2527990 RepID=A0A518J0G0_9BACT|nr:hypothetical protein [Rosistilla oblonga]QDV13013.1 hypothetical protein CA51_28990 [Rosistilla oblonga]QDV58818.1 hypothetical protein Mal33_48430 [Rosistilla oblonga]
MRRFAFLAVFTISQTLVCSYGYAEKVEAFGGAIKMETPEAWKSVQPRSRIVEKEYSISKEGVEGSARLTMMAAGGDIKANIDRWIGQFTAADGGSAKGSAKQEKLDVAGNEVHLIELQGTFKESMGGGPFAPGKTVKREDYEMLGAIVVNDGRKFFIKMTGPKAIVEDQKAAFKAMLKGIK